MMVVLKFFNFSGFFIDDKKNGEFKEYSDLAEVDYPEKTWVKIYCWRKSITKFFRIETTVSISKNTQRIHEEQSWLGIG